MSTLSVPQAAEVLKVHPKTVLDLITAGALPAAKIGRAWVMLERDVMNHIERQIVRQTSERLRSPECRSKVRTPKVRIA